MSEQDRDIISARLMAIAGLAKATAFDVQQNKLWDGELDNRIRQIHEQLGRIPMERS